MKPQPLPGTLSGLLDAAIADARRLSRRTYKPHYYEWHTLNDHRQCEICLGGSLIAGTLRFSPLTDLAPWMLPNATKNKLEALDAMRSGDWLSAYHLLYQQEPSIRIEARLSCLPQPSHADFIGWRAFNSHLQSLQRIIPKLRKIEKEALDE